MVECEYKMCRRAFAGGYSFNRYMVECEYKTMSSLSVEEIPF